MGLGNLEQFLGNHLSRRDFLTVFAALAAACSGTAQVQAALDETEDISSRLVLTPPVPLYNGLVFDSDGKVRNYSVADAPECTFTADASSCKYGLHDYLAQTQRPALLTFGAYWCYPCGLQTTPLNKMAETYKDSLQVVGVDVVLHGALDKTTVETREAFARHGAQFPYLLMHQNEVNATLGPINNSLNLPLPLNLVVNRQMEITAAGGAISTGSDVEFFLQQIDRVI